MEAKIHHLALRTSNLERLENFYATVFGFPVLRRGPRPDGSVWLAAGGVVVMIERAADGEPPVPPGSMELIAFAADAGDAGDAGDAAWKSACRARVEQAGSRVEGETPQTLYFRDPDGRRLAFSVHPLR